MTKSQPDKYQTTQVVLDIIKKNEPENTQQLIKLLQEKTALSNEEIAQLLIQLENEDRLHFTRKEDPVLQTFQTYFLSKRLAWYWGIITLSIFTTLAMLIIPGNSISIVYLRSVLVVAFVLFLPGYTFTRILFPTEVPTKNSTVKTNIIERLALSIALSLAFVAVAGIILNYSSWGIQPIPIILSLIVLATVFATGAVAHEYQVKAQTVKKCA